TGEPTIEPSDERLVLSVDDVEAGTGDGEPIGWREIDSAPEPSFECVPPIGDADHVIRRSFVPPDDGRLDQVVEISTPERAQARFDTITDAIRACVADAEAAGVADFQLDQVWTIEGVGDAAWIARYWAPPRVDDSLTLVTVSVALVGDTVTTIVQGGLAMDANLPPSDNLARLAAERLCAASGRDCAAEPDAQRLYPEPTPELSGWLTVADVVQLTRFDEITDVGELVDDEGTYGFACLEVDATAAGASWVRRRSYYDPLFVSDAVVDQAVARFPSATAAEAHFDRIAGDASDCDGGPPATVATGEVSGPGLRGATWRT